VILAWLTHTHTHTHTHIHTHQVTASMDARILVWDLSVYALRRTLNAGQNKGVYFLAYIPSQRYLISASFDHHCKVYANVCSYHVLTSRGKPPRIIYIYIYIYMYI
jgi:hypothetical protein